MKTNVMLLALGLTALALAVLCGGCALGGSGNRPSLLGGDADFSLFATRNSRTVTKLSDSSSNTVSGTSTCAPTGGGTVSLDAGVLTNLLKMAAATQIAEQPQVPVSIQTLAPESRPAFEPQAVRYYCVQDGDCLWSIAKQRGTTVEVLRHTNGLKTDVIHPGQLLALP